MNSGKLPLIEVDIKDTCHLAGILHALHGHLLELLRRDRLPVSEQADEFTGSMIEVLEVVPQLLCRSQQLLTGRNLEVSCLTVFHHPIGGVRAGCFHRLPRDAGLLLNLIADTGILLVREPVAQLIQHIVQMLLQRFTLELFLNGHSPAPVDPEDDLFLLCHLSHQPFPLLRQAAQWQRKPLPPAVWTA